MKNIEVEIRSLIDENKYHKLLRFFKKEGKWLGEDYQETYYFDCKEDLRIQKNNNFSKIWLKSGKIHDEAREEIEIKFDKEDFEKLEQAFLALGYKVGIKWFRTRNTFKWQGIKVCLDYTKGYGYIIELEKLANENEKDKVLDTLKQKLASLKIPLISREEFDKMFKHYKDNWKILIK
ncbi:MAG: CYTH domain-containing protein [Patescibacteria group bacterium]|nr:CYTH domain-containing protein [Patescibacteria group bacterium]